MDKNEGQQSEKTFLSNDYSDEYSYEYSEEEENNAKTKEDYIPFTMYNYCLLHSQPHLQQTRWNALRDSIDFISY